MSRKNALSWVAVCLLSLATIWLIRPASAIPTVIAIQGQVDRVGTSVEHSQPAAAALSNAPAEPNDGPPVPLPRHCDGLTPPGGTLPPCCVRGYIFYNNTPVVGASVRIESRSGVITNTTMDQGDGKPPHYRADLSSPPISATAGSLVTITAVYSDMVSSRTWIVQSFGQNVDLGMIPGYRAPGPLASTSSSASSAALSASRAGSQTVSALRDVPMIFVENTGQFAQGVRFQTRRSDRTIWLAEDAVWVTVLDRRPITNDQRPTMINEHPISKDGPWSVVGGQSSVQGVNLKLSFVGANPHPRLEPFSRLDTNVSYFIGNDPSQWHSDVPVWGGVRYVDMYPGIDFELDSAQGQLVQRLVVRPGADLGAVRLRVDGADTMTLDGDHLHLTTTAGDFSLPLLQLAIVDSSSVAVGGNPQVIGNEVASPFAAGNLALGSSVLSVDSTSGTFDLLYATYLGGSGDDYGNGIAVDSAGMAYIAGHTYSPNFPTTPGAFDTTFAGPTSSPGGDAFVVKLNSSGSALVYATYLGGGGRDWIHGIRVDASGAAYVVGETSSSDFPVTPGAFDTSYNGGLVDGFVAKLNPAGNGLVYATFLGGGSDEAAKGLAVDTLGSAYMTGYTWSSNFPTTAGAFDTSHNGNMDAFVTKFNADGTSLVYSTLLGGSDHDWVNHAGIVVDASGAAYIAGRTNSANFPTTPGAFDTTHNGGTVDAFVTKLNASGSALVYSTFLGGSAHDEALDIAIDSSGAAYVVGGTASSDFPVTSGAYDTSYNGGADDTFVFKLNSTGSALVYATFVGGSNYDMARVIALDGNGAAYISGETASSNFPTTLGAFDTVYNGGEADAFVVKISPAGNQLERGTFLGGSSGDWGQGGITVDGTGAVYVAGFTQSSDFPTTTLAFDTSHNGSADAFVVKLTMEEVRLVMYGGGASGQYFEDLWQYDGADWTQLTWPGQGPGARTNYGMAYDRRRGRLAMFGGQDQTQMYSDTWEYTGQAWVQVNTLHAPSPRWEPNMAYDTRRGVTVLFGGGPGGYIFYTDTWEYDGTDWRQVSTAHIPPGSTGANMVYDEARGRVVLVTAWQQSSWVNETWEYDGVDWSYVTQAPSSRLTFHLAYDPNRQRTVLFSGYYPPNSGCDYTDTWEYNGTSWQQIATAHNPVGRCSGSMAYDLSRKVVVLFGGGNRGAVYSDTWEYDGTDWRQATPPHQPSARTGARLVAMGNLFLIPTAQFTATPTSGKAPLMVQFIDQSAGDITAWTWSFGDGGGSGARYPEHEYTNAGVYTVTLYVVGPGGSDIETKANYIAVNLRAEFDAAPMMGAAPLTVTFTDRSMGGVTSWLWNFGDGGTSTIQSPTHIYNSPGGYTVSLAVSGPAGSDTVTKSSYINVTSGTIPYTWTFMLYFAGDNNLSPYLNGAIDEMERVANNPNVNIYVLFDGWENGDTRLYHVQYNTQPGIQSPVIPVGWNLGNELDTGVAQMLINFATWVQDNSQSHHYLLAIANHGRGTTGIAWDDRSADQTPYLDAYSELNSALSQITTGGAHKIDVLYLDACLMGLIEDAYEVKDYVDYLVASQNLGWSVFAYQAYVAGVTSNTTPRQLAQNIVEAYFAALPGYPRTVSALDLTAFPALDSAVTTFALELNNYVSSTNVAQIIAVRNNVQVFDSRNYGTLNSTDDEYIDLYHLANLIRISVSSPSLQNAASGLMNVITNSVIAEHHQSATDPWTSNYWNLDNAHGIAIYFPPRSGGWDYLNYVGSTSWAFCNQTQWDEFLLKYFQISGLPPEIPTPPGVPWMPAPKYYVYVPVVMRGH